MRAKIAAIVLLCFFLSGCHSMGDRIKEPVRFYYVRTAYQEDLSSAVLSESREASGHLEDLGYLLALYLMGPVSEQLTSPLPPGTRIHVSENTGEAVTLSLSEAENSMNDTQFSLACACLSYTCMDITGANAVTIISGSRSITMTRDNLTLWDANPQEPTEETT